ncbi:amino acid permease [Clostridium carboxidivorans P7]|uniref:Amino acid permease-associated region n=1 Tax=Clostridium carboxidivorans P7 TaxID=536227 RepID=C6PTL3_9CLOT|nr:amino acid permease [Clostridium carboxidivorans]AKN31770.1 amino acid permease [Clostridium carboxidivorans P7]EET87443.1 amino acid permease-associated region [Clostridium carboxidivorans P7]EFG87401.1 hypothetical protein CLCAR_2929 [Clostridium carboxidivorans P7]
MTVIATITAWITILLAHSKFRKEKVNKGEKTDFKMPFYPYFLYATVIYLVLIVISLAFLESTRIALYVAPVWILLLIIMYKLLLKQKVNLSEVKANN